MKLKIVLACDDANNILGEPPLVHHHQVFVGAAEHRAFTTRH